MPARTPHEWFRSGPGPLRAETSAPPTAPAAAAQPQPLPRQPPTPAQLDALVDRVEGVVVGYALEGVKMGLHLSGAQLLEVLDRTIRAADGQPAAPVVEGDAMDFYLEGLYLEIVQEAEGIYDRQKFDDGSEDWAPLGAAEWRACLVRLRERVARDVT